MVLAGLHVFSRNLGDENDVASVDGSLRGRLLCCHRLGGSGRLGRGRSFRRRLGCRRRFRRGLGRGRGRRRVRRCCGDLREVDVAELRADT